MYQTVIQFFHDFTLASAACRMFLSVLLGSVIGAERGRHGIAAGFRTHVLVCLGACVTALIGIYGQEILGFTGDPMRISAQVISGIGFLGIGSIFIVGKRYIRGLTTAAGLWATAATGIAVGVGAVEIAVIAMAIIALTMTVMHRLGSTARFESRYEHFYIELTDPADTNRIVDILIKEYHMTETSVVQSRSKSSGHIGIEAISRPSVSRKAPPHPDIANLLKEESVIIAVKFR